MKEIEIIEETAYQILRGDPDPVVRFRLLKDVLKTRLNDDVFVGAKREMLKSRWVSELKRDQDKDGGWGRFHSMDTKTKRKIKTTEIAVERGLALGLEANDPIFQDTVSYLSRLLEGSIDFPDPPERNDRWPTGRQLFVAATLARLQPTLSVLDDAWELWANIARRTFAAGRYDPEAEIRAHLELTGSSVKDSYLVLSNKYSLTLLGSRATHLSNKTINALVCWIWHKKGGIGYVEIPLSNPPVHLSTGMIDRWFTSIELLSCFPSWRRFANDAINWVWTQRNEEGLWDFGPVASISHYFPLSESWRRKQNRKYDQSTRVLSLLRNYYSHNRNSTC